MVLYQEEGSGTLTIFPIALYTSTTTETLGTDYLGTTEPGTMRCHCGQRYLTIATLTTAMWYVRTYVRNQISHESASHLSLQCSPAPPLLRLQEW